MHLQELKIIKFDDKKGPTYDCGKVKLLVRKKGAICAGHRHSVQEIFYLIRGEMELTIEDETKVVKAFTKILIQPNEYHKFVALSDLEIIEDREGE